MKSGDNYFLKRSKVLFSSLFFMFQRVSYNPVIAVVVDVRNVETDVKKFEDVFDAAKNFGHPIYFVRIEAAVDEDSFSPEKIESKDQIGSKIFGQSSNIVETILSSTKDETSRHFLRQCLKKKALLRSAESLGCSKIFLSECSNDLAVGIIAGSILKLSNLRLLFFQSIQLFLLIKLWT